MSPVIFCYSTVPIERASENGFPFHASPEESFAALTCHGIEVETSRFVSADSAYSGYILIKFHVRIREGCTCLPVFHDCSLAGRTPRLELRSVHAASSHRNSGENTHERT